MGAISALATTPVLLEFLTDEQQTVRETCEIALAKIEWDHSEEGAQYRLKEAEAESGEP